MLALAIGLGATMGILSLMNALLFKALPVPQPEQLWKLGHNAPEGKDDNFSYRMFGALQKANSSRNPLFAISGAHVRVDYGTKKRDTLAITVSDDTFRILKLKAYMGCLLSPGDDQSVIRPGGATASRRMCSETYKLQNAFGGSA